MTKQLTETEALEKTMQMWLWLAENPNKEKVAWFIEVAPDDSPVRECYLCEYVFRRSGGCIDCTLYGKWANGDLYSDCVCLGSPYLRYLEHSFHKQFEQKSEAAREIVELCRKELEKLRNDESGKSS